MCRRGRPLSLGVAADFIALSQSLIVSAASFAASLVASLVASFVASFASSPERLGRRLSARGLARLPPHVLADVPDPFSLVRLGRPEIADDRRDLANQLLVVSADHDARLRLRGDRDPLRRVVLDRVRVAQLQYKLLSGHLGAVS